jgi:hypothetical protein
LIQQIEYQLENQLLRKTVRSQTVRQIALKTARTKVTTHIPKITEMSKPKGSKKGDKANKEEKVDLEKVGN